MTNFLQFTLVIIIFLNTSSTYGTEPDLEKLKRAAASLELSQSETWHKLLIYRRGLLNGYKSAIHTSTFFLSQTGNKDPKAELNATLDAFFKPPEETKGQHPQCKFRGRYFWLSETLNFDQYQLPAVECDEFNRWTLNGEANSTSFIFATGYLSNPASYYGHTLIKLNSDTSQRITSLEEITVNYGAIETESDGPIPYVLKGLFGGYDAGFSHIQYYYHTHNYGEIQQRDLWEYELNLSPAQNRLLLGHIWEVMGEKYTYYFLSKNCAYRMGEIIEVISGVDVLPNNPVWLTPQSLIQKMAKAKIGNKPLVKSINFTPSRQSKFYQRYEQLSHTDKQRLGELIANIEFLYDDKFQSLSSKEKYALLDTAIDYFQYIRKEDKLAGDVNNTYYRKVLAERYKLAPKPNPIEFDNSSSPTTGRKGSLFSVGSIDNHQLGVGYSLRIRPAYYDALDSSIGHIPFSELTMGDIQLKYLSDKLKLEKLVIFNVESINNTRTKLPGDDSSAWKIGMGIRRTSLLPDSVLTPYFYGDIGHSLFWMGGNAYVAAYLGAGLQKDTSIFSPVYGALTIEGGIKPFEKMKIISKVQYRDHARNTPADRTLSEIQLRYAMFENLDLRLSYKKDMTSEFLLSTSKYW